MEAIRISLVITLIMIHLVHQASSSCRDTRRSCRKWAKSGECKKNPRYMKQFCMMSCKSCPKGVCKDTSKHCAAWSRDGYCKKSSKYYTWMKEKCRKACKFCREKGVCKDTSKHCAAWNHDGYCKKSSNYYTWMKMKCRKACKFCKEKGYKAVINDKHCGVRQTRKRVVGGIVSVLGKWPWQAGIARINTPNTVFCGGTLINRQWVLTANHCFGHARSKRVKPHHLIVRLGDHNLDVKEGSEVISTVSMIIRHKDFKAGSKNHDIALLKLSKPIKYSSFVKPICLPKQGFQERVGTKCYVSGWGRISERGQLSTVLQEARIPIVRRIDCAYKLLTAGVVTKYMICAGHQKGGIDSCEGDSGGPFVCINGGQFEQIGIVSWGKGCARANAFGVYTKVSHYIDWIKKNIQQ